jgi:hypothetical protein
MSAFSRKTSHNLSETPEFVVVQPPLTTLDGELSSPLRWVLSHDVQPSSVTEKPP